MCIKTGKVKKSALSLLLFANHCNYNTIGLYWICKEMLCLNYYMCTVHYKLYIKLYCTFLTCTSHKQVPVGTRGDLTNSCTP